MRRTVKIFIVAICVAVPATAGQTPRPSTPREVAPEAVAASEQQAPPALAATAAPSGQRATAPAPTPPAQAQGTPAPRPVDPRIDQSDVNIKMSVTITDKGATTMTKIVSLILANKGNGRVRSSGTTTVPNSTNRNSELNVDARATWFKNGSILTNMTITYTPEWTDDATKFTGVSQSVELYLKDGVPMVIAQAADPTRGSRSVTIEVTASVVK